VRAVPGDGESLERVIHARSVRLAVVELELSPEQPAAVVAAFAALLADPPSSADPWWQAGLDEALET
jgi:hypothetical protein